MKHDLSRLSLSSELAWDSAEQASPNRIRFLRHDDLGGGNPDRIVDQARRDYASGEVDFLLYVKELQVYNPELVSAVCAHFGNILLDHGLPSGHSKCDLFFGKYRSTPGGVHRESCTNLHTVIDGGKVFYTWTDDVVEQLGYSTEFESRETSAGTEDYLASINLEDISHLASQKLVGPGGFVKLEPWRWHIAEAPRPCVSLNVATYKAQPQRQYLPVERTATGMVSPGWLRTYAHFAAGAAGSGPDSALAAASAGGLVAPQVPDNTDTSSNGDMVVRRVGQAPALWARLDQHLVVAIGGQAMKVSRGAESCAEWLGSHSQSAYRADTDDEQTLVAWLLELGHVSPAVEDNYP